MLKYVLMTAHSEKGLSTRSLDDYDAAPNAFRVF